MCAFCTTPRLPIRPKQEIAEQRNPRLGPGDRKHDTRIVSLAKTEGVLGNNGQPLGWRAQGAAPRNRRKGVVTSRITSRCAGLPARSTPPSIFMRDSRGVVQKADNSSLPASQEVMRMRIDNYNKGCSSTPFNYRVSTGQAAFNFPTDNITARQVGAWNAAISNHNGLTT